MRRSRAQERLLTPPRGLLPPSDRIIAACAKRAPPNRRHIEPVRPIHVVHPAKRIMIYESTAGSVNRILRACFHELQ